MIQPDSALIVVDMQNDFITGSLAVPQAAEIIKPVNEYIVDFTSKRLPVFFTADWHIKDHPSFKEQGGQWPAHCVMDTPGAEFVYQMMQPSRAYDHSVIAKGVIEEAYSGFERTALDNLLQLRKVKTLYVCGLALDYCVKATALDGKRLGYGVYVLGDAVKPVTHEGLGTSVYELVKAGIHVI